MDNKQVLSLENSLHKLSIENESLRNDLLKIQKQFDEALMFEKDLNDLRDDYNNLNGKHRNIISENNNLTQRLQISLQKVDELSYELQRQREINSASNDQIVEKYNKKIDEINAAYKLKINNLEEKLLEANKSCIQREEHCERLANQFKYILELTSKHFDIDIDTFDDAVRVLSAPSIRNNTYESIEIQKNETSDDDLNNRKEDNTSQSFLDLAYEIKSVKKDMRKKFVKEHRVIVNDLLKDFKSREASLIQKIRRLECSNSEKSTEINNLETKNYELINEKMMLKTQNDILIQKNTQEINDKMFYLEQQKNNLTSENDKLKSEIVEFKKQIHSLVFKLQNSEKNLVVFKTNNTGLEQKVLLLESTIAILEEQINKLNENESAAEDQAKSFNARLNERIAKIKELQTTISNVNIENEKLKQDLFYYRGEIKHLAAENETLKKEVNDHQESLSEYKRKFRSSEDENKTLSSKLAIATKEVQEIRTKLNNHVEPEEFDLTSLVVWKSVPFPSDLSSMINEIALNDSFKAPAKLKNIFVLIHKWYSDEINKISTDFSSSKANLDKVMDENRELISNIKQLLATIDTSSSEIPDSKTISKCKKYIKDLKNDLAKEKDKRMKLDEFLLNIYGVVDTENFADCISKISELKKMAYTLSKSNKMIKEKYKKKIRNYKEQIEGIEQSVHVLYEEKSQLENDIDRANHDIESISLNKKALEETLERISKENDQRIKEIEMTSDLRIAELTKKVEELTLLCNSEIVNKNKLTEELENVNQKNLQLEAQVDEALSMCEAKNKSVHQLRQQIKESEGLWRSRQESQREAIMNKHESIIQDLTQTLDEHKDVIKNLENENSCYKQKNSDLELKLRGLELKITSLNSEFQRDKALLESKFRTDKLSLESSYDERIQDYSKKLENDKRNMYALVGMSFSSLCNTTAVLDGVSFERVIKNASDVLKKYVEEDSKLRKMLSLGPEQSVVDAVASYLYR